MVGAKRHVLINIIDSFNSTLLATRDKPILTMVEWIRTYIIKRFTAERNDQKQSGDVMCKPMNRLSREIEFSSSWYATWLGGPISEVTHSVTQDKYVVNLEKQSCTCNFWDLVGIPSRHVVTAIRNVEGKLEIYVHRYYKKYLYKMCYEQIISPIHGHERWPRANEKDILPPAYKRWPGRPKKLRRREVEFELGERNRDPLNGHLATRSGK